MAGAKLVNAIKEIVIKKEVPDSVELTLSLVEAQALVGVIGKVVRGTELTDSIYFKLNNLGFEPLKDDVYKSNEFTTIALEKITKMVNKKFNLEN